MCICIYVQLFIYLFISLLFLKFFYFFIYVYVQQEAPTSNDVRGMCSCLRKLPPKAEILLWHRARLQEQTTNSQVIIKIMVIKITIIVIIRRRITIRIIIIIVIIMKVVTDLRQGAQLSSAAWAWCSSVERTATSMASLGKHQLCRFRV